jgi:hypothetical protein
MHTGNAVECDAVMEYLRGRGISAIRDGAELVLARVGSLNIGFWCPRHEFPELDDVESARRALRLGSLDVLVIVSYRPYVLVDYLSALVERAQRWYGIRMGVKLLGVSSVELEAGLEDALGRAFLEAPQKLGGGVMTDDVCPQCRTARLRLYRSERYFSRKYYRRVLESIMACTNCGVRIRRLELLD